MSCVIHLEVDYRNNIKRRYCDAAEAPRMINVLMFTKSNCCEVEKYAHTCTWQLS